MNARDDPGKQRIRECLGKVCDEKLVDFGLSADDIALLREPIREPLAFLRNVPHRDVVPPVLETGDDRRRINRRGG
jgi:hypothetical protein